MMKNLFCRAHNHVALYADFLIWQNQTRPMRRMLAPTPTRTVVFCNLLSTIATTKFDTILAHALHQRGYRIVVLMPQKTRYLERLFTATVDCEFVYLNDFITDEIRSEALAKTKKALSGFSCTRDFLDMEVDGFRIGRSAFSSVLRTVRKGKVNFDDPETKVLIIECLSKAFTAIKSSELLLDVVKPDTIIVLERGYPPAAEFSDACSLRNIPVIAWSGAPLSDQLVFKRYQLANRSTHRLSLDEATWNWLKNIPWRDEFSRLLLSWWEEVYLNGMWFDRQGHQTNKVAKTRDQLTAQLGLDPAKKTAVIFCHIFYDASFFFGVGIFPDYQQWLVEAVKCAIANPNLNWVVKVHPVNIWRSKADGKPMEALERQVLRKEFSELPDHIKILDADTDINTLSLFREIDYGLTVRGTVGLELPCYGKPMITAGTGRYSGRGFTVDPKTPEEFRQVLATLHERPPLDEKTVKTAIRHAFGVFFLRPQKIESFQFNYNVKTFGSSLLASNISVSPGSWKYGNVPPDIGDLATWISASDATDFLGVFCLPKELRAYIIREMSNAENTNRLFFAK